MSDKRNCDYCRHINRNVKDTPCNPCSLSTSKPHFEPGMPQEAAFGLLAACKAAKDVLYAVAKHGGFASAEAVEAFDVVETAIANAETEGT